MTHPFRPPADKGGFIDDHGFCPDCGKIRLLSKADAKRLIKRRFPHDRMNAYQCGDHWHIGHLAPVVKTGEKDRSIYKNRRLPDG